MLILLKDLLSHVLRLLVGNCEEFVINLTHNYSRRDKLYTGDMY